MAWIYKHHLIPLIAYCLLASPCREVCGQHGNNQQQGTQGRTLVTQPTRSQTAQNMKSLESRVDQLERSLDRAQVQTDRNIAAIRQTNDRAFDLMQWFSGILVASGTVGGTVILWLSYMRERRHRQEYDQREKQHRQEYDQRDDQRERRYRQEYDRERNFFEKIMDAQHHQSLQVSNQHIDSIAKLGGVIDLVNELFTLQLSASKKYEDFHRKYEKLHEILENDLNANLLELEKSSQLMRTHFQKYSRVKWANLTPLEKTIANDCKNKFDRISTHAIKFIVENKKGDDDGKRKRNELGQLYQLLGVNAFCSNDIVNAIEYFREAREIFGDKPRNDQFRYPQAYSSFYRALIEKNWCQVDDGDDVAHTFKRAKDLLEEAQRLRKDAIVVKKDSTLEDDHLTQLTLAEVQTYLKSDRESASQLLKNLIAEFENLHIQKKLSDNQRPLLRRAYLIRGNIDFMEGRINDANKWYDAAVNFAPEHPYTLLSRALVSQLTNEDGWESKIDEGLEVLENSDQLTREEIGLKFTAIAWVALCARLRGDNDKYDKCIKDLKEQDTRMPSIASRCPLFFSPTKKLPLRMPDLIESISSEKLVKGRKLADGASAEIVITQTTP